MPTRTTPKSLRIAVMLEEVQLADIVGIDLFGNASTAMAKAAERLHPAGGLPPEHAAMHADLVANAIDITWYYLGPSTSTPSSVTASLKYLPNTTYADCPRDLDIVITGGPFPDHRPAEADRFVKEAWPKTRTWITVCTGSMWIASTGVLDGKQAVTNRGAVGIARMMYSKVEWLEQRWLAQEKEYEGEGRGELWTGAGAGAGIDMIATYVLQHFGEEYVRRTLFPSLEFDPEGPKGQFYPDVKDVTGKAAA